MRFRGQKYLQFWERKLSPLMVITSNRLLCVFFLSSVVLSLCFSFVKVNPVEQWLHDKQAVSNLRGEWVNSALVIRDSTVPFSLSREQTLTLYALAAERLALLDAKSVFLDAKILLKNFRGSSLAQCITDIGAVNYCALSGQSQRCSTHAGNLRMAPLDIDPSARSVLSLPLPTSEYSPPPLFFLFGPEYGQKLSKKSWVDVSLPESDDGIIREVYAEPNTLYQPYISAHLDSLSECTHHIGKQCIKVRSSHPLLVQDVTSKPVIPLSELASCSDRWQNWKDKVENRDIILQMTGADAQSDRYVTSSTVHLEGYSLTSGSHWLLDGLETIKRDDSFKKLSFSLSLITIILLSAVSLVLSNYFRLVLALFVIASTLTVLFTVPFMVDSRIFLPYTTWVIALLVPLVMVIIARNVMGEARARLVSRFVPPQISTLLISQNRGRAIRDQKVTAVVLMSDLQGFTKITASLSEPTKVLSLMNHYLEAATQDLQEKYNAWLEAYVADLVCFYWPQVDDSSDITALREQAVSAMLLLYKNQSAFFSKIPELLEEEFSEEDLCNVRANINAGIALAEGEVVMGELGPKNGIKKFGLLGAALNLASRMEGLSRFFTANMLVTEEFTAACYTKNLFVRRLACIRFKGMLEPVQVYAVHPEKFAEGDRVVKAWHTWLEKFEQGIDDIHVESPYFNVDAKCLQEWRSQGYWNEAGRYFDLPFK